ncbi:hypothetical protein ACFL54_02845 [Planctomycetota bacterium]
MRAFRLFLLVIFLPALVLLLCSVQLYSGGPDAPAEVKILFDLDEDRYYQLTTTSKMFVVPKAKIGKKKKEEEVVPNLLVKETQDVVVLFEADFEDSTDHLRFCKKPLFPLYELPLFVLSLFQGDILERGKELEFKYPQSWFNKTKGAQRVGKYRGKILYREMIEYEGKRYPLIEGEMSITRPKGNFLKIPARHPRTKKFIDPLVRDNRIKWRAVFDPRKKTILHMSISLESSVVEQPKNKRAIISSTGGIPSCWREKKDILIEVEGTGRSLHTSTIGQVEIDLAIHKARNYLSAEAQKYIKKNRSHAAGCSALVALALLKAGKSPDDQVFVFLLREMIKPYFQIGAYDTYSPSLLLMAGEEYIRVLAKLDEERQKKCQCQVKSLKRKMDEVLVVLLKSLAANKGWGSPDLSNTQYGILGLHAARRAGIFTEETHSNYYRIWAYILEVLLQCQQEEGPGVLLQHPLPKLARASGVGESGATGSYNACGWDYGLNQRAKTSYGSMTCTGIASVGIAYQYLMHNANLSEFDRQTLVAKSRMSIAQGLAWLQLYYSARFHPGENWEKTQFPHAYFYYLYAIERAGVILNVKKFGAHDWYREGTTLLLGSQLPDGSWLSKGYGENYLVATSFAILFLKRASMPVTSGRPEDD